MHKLFINSVLIVSLLLFSCAGNEDNRDQSAQISSNTKSNPSGKTEIGPIIPFEERFSLQDLQSFDIDNLDSAEYRNMDPEMFTKLVNQHIIEFQEHLEDGIDDYLSEQVKRPNYRAGTFDIASGEVSIIEWVNFDNSLNVIDHVTVAGGIMEEGSGENTTTTLENDTTLVISTVKIDMTNAYGADNPELPKFTVVKDSIIEKKVILPTGKFKTISKKKYDKSYKVSKEDIEKWNSR